MLLSILLSCGTKFVHPVSAHLPRQYIVTCYLFEDETVRKTRFDTNSPETVMWYGLDPGFEYHDIESGQHIIIHTNREPTVLCEPHIKGLTPEPTPETFAKFLVAKYL